MCDVILVYIGVIVLHYTSNTLKQHMCLYNNSEL